MRKEYTKLQAHHKRVKDDLKEIGQESKQSNRFQTMGLATIGKQLAGVATGYASVQGAIRLVTDEFTHMIEVQRRAKETTITTADAQIKALRNLGATTAKGRDQFVTQVQEISRETGVSEKDIYLRASAALSARGDLSVAAAMGAVRESARLVPESAQEGTAVAGAALDLAKITGSQKAAENIGLLMAIGQTARVVDVGMLAEHVAPAVTGLTARGDTPRQAGAIWSALTTGMADPTGRRSGTAAIQLANQLAEFLPEEDTFKYVTKTRRGQKIEERVLDRPGTGLTSTLERIEYLQDNQEAREKFFAAASFEQKSKATVEQMLTGRGTGATALAQFLERIPGVAEAGGLYAQRLDVIRGGEIQQTADFSRRGGTFAERMELMNQEWARLGAARENTVRILENTGQSALATRLRQFEFNVTGAPAVDRMVGMLERRREELLRPRTVVDHHAGIYGATSRLAPPTEMAQMQATAIGELVTELRGLRADIAAGRAAPAGGGRPRGVPSRRPAAGVNQHVE
jgi:hypothetical protein